MEISIHLMEIVILWILSQDHWEKFIVQILCNSFEISEVCLIKDCFLSSTKDLWEKQHWQNYSLKMCTAHSPSRYSFFSVKSDLFWSHKIVLKKFSNGKEKREAMVKLRVFYFFISRFNVAIFLGKCSLKMYFKCFWFDFKSMFFSFSLVANSSFIITYV